MEQYIVKKISEKLGLYHHEALLLYRKHYSFSSCVELAHMAWFVQSSTACEIKDKLRLYNV